MATNAFTVLPGVTDASTITILFNGQPRQVAAGVSVAAALLGSGMLRMRASPVSGTSRAPYCMMGVCFECLVEIDGVPNRQGCLVPVQDGMEIRSQEGRTQLESRNHA
ncbi:(2Fe-2S)-binding protein [Alcaligenaceae bacterium]|uniref:(2Fe-2S)-binding protein n=1 Tax=Pusillimonas sp. MFBS29 TaxID=2886690 RepID=UPI0015D3BEAE|nr:(2Fe-2S)-binding protein [Pusillimonas sp. MFBS29]MCC2596237.1 (2Fe-2S)-binding protein [Pusillimonas sp. MFBS29]NYT58620.1 (2Fe-2S)-binding protein [Alcaligenaceae bacterium]